MILSTLIRKNSLLVGSEGSVLPMKTISQSCIKRLWPSLENDEIVLMKTVLVECFPICYVPFATFVVVPPVNCGTYILNTTKFTWEKLNQAFVITIKRVVYLINVLGHKTLKSVFLFYVATIFTYALSTTKCTFFPFKWVHCSSN